MASKRTWEVRQALPEDSPQLTELFRVVFEFARSASHDRWKFDDNPYGPPVIAVADDHGTLVGQYALWPMALRLGQQVTPCAQSLDTMTHPDYRGQGMFTVLAEECMRYAAKRGIEALFGFPNENSFPGFVRRLDWDHTGDIPLWFRPLTIGRHRRVPAWGAATATAAARLLPKGDRGGFEVVAMAPLPVILDAFLERCARTSGACRVERTTRYLSWRFSSDSDMQYRWASVYRDNALKAFGVWGIDLRTGNAVLAELLSDDAAAASAALARMLRDALIAQCPLMLAASARPQLAPVFRRASFMKRGCLPLIVRKLTPRTLGANVHVHANWDIFGADLDTF